MINMKGYVQEDLYFTIDPFTYLCTSHRDIIEIDCVHLCMAMQNRGSDSAFRMGTLISDLRAKDITGS